VKLDVLNWSEVRRDQCAVSLENANRARAIIISTFSGSDGEHQSFVRESKHPYQVRARMARYWYFERVLASQDNGYTLKLTNPGARPQ
jgi:hypothetical protein